MAKRFDIANKPPQNSDPWYSTRTNYDNSLEYHLDRAYTMNNSLNGTTHLDDLVTPEDQGSYWISNAWNNIGVPFQTNQSLLLEVTGGTSYTSVQRLIDSRGITWRRRIPSGVNQIIWGPWHIAEGHRAEHLPSNTNLNNMVGPEYAGSWTIFATAPIQNLPYGLYQTTQLTIEYGGSNAATTQRLSDSDMTSWRKHFPGSGWGPWKVDYTTFPGEVRVCEMGVSGQVTNAIGDIHSKKEHGIASITKVLTAIVAMDLVNSSSHPFTIGRLVTVDYQEDRPIGLAYSAPLLDGDRLSISSLLRLSLIPSDNMAPMTIARTMGEHLSGTGSGYDKFVLLMNKKLIEMGIVGASAGEPTSQAKLSTYDICKMMVYIWANRSSYQQIIDDMGRSSIVFTIWNAAGTTREHRADNVVVQGFEGSGASYGGNFQWGKGGNHFLRTHLAGVFNRVGTSTPRFLVMTDGRTGMARGRVYRMLMAMSDYSCFPNTNDSSGVDVLPHLHFRADLNDLEETAEYWVRSNGFQPPGMSGSLEVVNGPSYIISGTSLLKIISWPGQLASSRPMVHQELYHASNKSVRTRGISGNWSVWHRVY